MAVSCTRKGSLYLTHLRSGKSQLVLSLAGEVFSSPVVCGSRVVIGCRDNFVYCFDLAAAPHCS